MKQWKRAAVLCLAAALCLTLAAGCGQPQNAATGLNLSVCMGRSPQTLDPIRATSREDETVLIHLYENLMRTTADTAGGSTTVNGAAKSYESKENYDGTVTYTFRLRSTKWSDGTAVTADDFVYAWQRLADPASQSPSAMLLSTVAGYDEVRATGDATKLQVEAKNESTLTVTLTGECPWFLTDVCTAAATVPLRRDVVQSLKDAAIRANKAAEAAGETGTATWSSDWSKLVTNGAYRYSASDKNSLTLASSETYSGSIRGGPDSITFRFAGTTEDAWALYEAEEVDFVAPLPEEETAKRQEDENTPPVTELNTGLLLFNTGADPFSDPKARKAFSMAVDRTALRDAVGPTAVPASGLVPDGVPGTEDEDFRTVGGALLSCDQTEYESNCELARSLLAEAGYDRSRGLSELELLYVIGGNGAAVARALAGMWSSALGAEVKVVGLSAADFETAISNGEYAMALTELQGYANDAESFLSGWKSDSERNVVGYRNSAFDTLLTVIDSANSATARQGCLHDAESLLLEDCPLSPLYFTTTAWELRDNLTGACRDARGWFSFATVAVREAG